MDSEATHYWTRLYRNMGKHLMSALPFLSSLKPQEIALPKKSPQAYCVPTQLIWGAEDRFNPLWVGKDMEAQLKKHGANVAFHAVPSSGHFVQEEQPEKVATLLLKMWESSRSS